MEIRYCAAELYAGTRDDPPEHCDEEAAEGSDYCERHSGASCDIWDLADEAHDRLRDERLGL